LKAVSEEQVKDALEKVVKKELRKGLWPVWKHYTLSDEDGEIVAPPLPLFHPEEQAGGVTRWVMREPGEDIHIRYAPLMQPELLLEFTALADQPISPEIVYEWVENYGVLGTRDVDVLVLTEGLGEHTITGGARRESVPRFAEEAFALNRCLRLYEAATASAPPDRARVAVAVAHEPGWAIELKKQHDAEVEEWALGKVLESVQSRLYAESHSQLYRYSTGEVVGGLGFRSLLGAMWMQMSWILMADTAITRCKLRDCRKVINFEPGEPPPSDAPRGVRGKRKTHRNKKFCNHNCAANYSYRKKAGWHGYT
jgi:hypothetical protein